MLNKKEFGTLIILTIIIAFSITLHKLGKDAGIEVILPALLGVFLALTINILVKKITAFYLDSEIEIKIWEFKRWGVRAHDQFKKGFPAGAFLPLIFAVILAPLKGFTWLGTMVFDVKAKKYKTAKRHGYYSFSEATENNIGGIAAAGVIANLFFAVVFYMIGAPYIAKINIWLAFWSMIPISDLDGNKIFFGNYVLWIILAIISLIALGYGFWLV
jgi:Zn-dependent protease